MSEVIKKNGIKTRLRTKEEIDALWNVFKEKHAEEFEKFMGYGIKDIEHIGYDKFINFWDVSSEEEMDFKKDVVKIIPCIHCKNEFTTYQLDFGLCPKCQKEYNTKKFKEMCMISDEADPGSSEALLAAFVYLGFKDFFWVKAPFEERVKLLIEVDDLSGTMTKDFLADVIGKKAKEEKFIECCKDLKMTKVASRKLESIVNILNSGDNKENKAKRIESIYKVV